MDPSASFDWDFGDGGTAAGVEVRHQYTAGGRYQVVLKIKDDTDLSNNSDSDTLYVTVNETPVAVAERDKDYYCVGEEVRFNGQKSSDPDGTVGAYFWDFGDGHSGGGMEVTHTYDVPGIYNATLTVDDGTSLENSHATAWVSVRVNNTPIAEAGSVQLVCPGVLVTLNASKSTDREDDNLNYHWDFGDGGQADGMRVTHAYETPGRYEARVTVTDNSGTACAVAEDVTIVIVNAAPVAVAGDDQEAFIGGAHDAITFDGKQSSDPEGAPLTYEWDLGDGSIKNGVKISHTYTKPGKYVVRLKVSDASETNCNESSDELIVDVKKRGEDFFKAGKAREE